MSEHLDETCKTLAAAQSATVADEPRLAAAHEMRTVTFI